MKRKRLFTYAIGMILFQLQPYLAAQQKTAILITGTGRSGSSCVAGIVNILGAHFGSDQLQANSHNPKGFFEYVPNITLHERMLKGLSMSNMKPMFIDWSTHPNTTENIHMIKNHIKKEFENYPLFAIKDPRLCYFLPLYISALTQLGYVPKIIIALRHPQKACLSIKEWPTPNITMSDLYWRAAVQFSMLLKDIFSTDALTIYYDELLQNPEAIINQITSFVPQLRTYEDAAQELASFIDPNLNHY